MNAIRHPFRLLLCLLLTQSLHAQTPDGSMPSINNIVNACAVQPDGRILIGGDFTNVGRVERNRIARLNADGSLDTSFNPNLNSPVRAIAVQPDGKILIGGSFTAVGAAGTPRNNIARLNADGTLDSAFNPNANYGVTTIALQSNGKILIGGTFTTVGGSTRLKLARLEATGAVDASFNISANNAPTALVVQNDGKILVSNMGGSFAGVPFQTVVRINSDGTMDKPFMAGVTGAVHAIALQPDGRIMIGGSFTTVGGVARNRIARLNSDSTLDPTFDPNAGGDVYSLALQANGSILMGGYFTTAGGVERKRIARLNGDGSLDPAFSYGGIPYGGVTSLAVMPDGKIQLGGQFLIRLTNDIAATSALAITGTSQIDWNRGGSAPEAGQVTFERWNGSAWVLLGNASPVAGGWRLTGLALPADGWIRARSLVPGGGSQASSSGLIEQIRSYGAPVSPDIAVATEDGIGVPYGAATVGFGSVIWPSASSLQKTLTITNTGNATLSGLGIALKGLNLGDFSVGAFPATTLAPGASLSVPLTFFPQGVTAGVKNALLTLSNNDPDESPFEISLVGAFLQCDPSFNPAVNGQVLGCAVQPDGKVLIGGGFATVGGTALKYGARLNADGTLDASFAPNPNSSVYAMAVQQDGRILVAGYFTTVGGVARNYIARLNPDGTLDPSFDPNASGLVTNLAVQTDGKILMAGSFTTVSGAARNYIARLNPDGTLDASFNSNPNGAVQSLAVQPDGKILIGGFFTSVGGTARNSIARLNASGTLDTTFIPDASLNDSVFSITLQPDGKILLAKRNTVVRVTSTGALDTGFTQGAGDGIVFSLALQADGKILAGGQFLKMGAVARNRIARFNADGSLDTTFDPNASDVVNSLLVQASGKVILGGLFTSVGGGAYKSLARLANNLAATSTLTITGTNQIDWTRGGSAPEISQVMFEKWNGSGWVKLGDATRVSGGWRLTGLALGSAGQIRARGRAAGGYFTGSSGLLEQTAGYGPCNIAIEAPAGTDLATGSAYSYGTRNTGSSTPMTFTVRNTGYAPLTLGSPGIAGPNAAEFTLTTTGMASTVAPGGQTTFQVTFAPATSGSKTATLSLTSNDSDETPFWLALTGAGNSVPVFPGYSVSTPFQTPAAIPFRKLLAKASDPDGDPLTLASADAVASRGGGVVLRSDSLLFTPAAGVSGTEAFNVTVSDGRGGTVTGVLTVTIGPAPSAGGANANPPRLATLPGGKMAISFQGIPGRSYTLQRSAGGLDDWQTLANLTADAAGKVAFTDDNPPPGSAFYRLGLP